MEENQSVQLKEQDDVGDSLSPVSNNPSPDDSWWSFHYPVTLKPSASNVPAGSGCSASRCHHHRNCAARRTPDRSDALKAWLNWATV